MRTDPPLYTVSFYLPGDDLMEPSVTYNYYAMIPPAPGVGDIVNIAPNVDKNERTVFVDYRVTRRRFTYCVGQTKFYNGSGGIMEPDAHRETASVDLWIEPVGTDAAR